MIVKDILASGYVLLGNIGEDELDYIIALEQFSNVWSAMKNEKILGFKNERILKGSLIFDSSGVVENDLTSYGTQVFLRFNDQPIEESTVSMLDLYRDSGKQAVAFWTDASDDTRYAQLAIETEGTLEVWYEISEDNESAEDEIVPLEDDLRYALAIRWAYFCIDYVNYKDPKKEAKQAMLKLSLKEQFNDWKAKWMERINRINSDRPIERLPFQAG